MILKLIYAVVIAVSASVASGGSIEAKKDDVEVFSAPDKGSAVVTKLKKGESLPAGDRNGMYWQVKLSTGGAGFVSVLNVKVKAEASGLSDALREAVKAGRSSNAQDGGRARSAVMGVRGLDDTSDTAYAGSVRPNLRAVYRMEDSAVAAEKFDRQADMVSRDIEWQMKGTVTEEKAGDAKAAETKSVDSKAIDTKAEPAKPANDEE